MFWAWLCWKDNSAFPRRFHLLSTKLTLNTPFSSTRREALRCNPLMGPPTCKIVGVKSMLSLSGQLRLEYGSQSRSTHQVRHKPPRRNDGPSSVSSLGCSATFDIAWRSLLHLPLQSKRNPMAAFINMYRYRESGESLGFKACTKS